MCGGKKADSKEEENEQRHPKQKCPVRDKLGDRPEMNCWGWDEITEDNAQGEVANEMSFRFQEPKKRSDSPSSDTIRNKKPIELPMETVELNKMVAFL